MTPPVAHQVVTFISTLLSKRNKVIRQKVQKRAKMMIKSPAG